ncbi:MAG TPA: RNA polymerase sigma factor [Candidatus Limnocylindria bacterium]|nr:RNA polymerase sigma factor [Candidatus Limnocylindria bacterium]
MTARRGAVGGADLAERSDARDPDLPAVRAAQRDRAAFDVLYRRYLSRVYGYAFYQLRNHHDAEDVTERVFLSALRGIDRYRDRGSTFRAWLFRIAHNTVANTHRSRARRRAEPLPEDAAWVAPNADPAGLVTRADELHAVLRAVATLPDDRRQVILLRFVDGLTAAEIGRVLGRSPGAVRVLQHRALVDLSARIRRG